MSLHIKRAPNFHFVIEKKTRSQDSFLSSIYLATVPGSKLAETYIIEYK